MQILAEPLQLLGLQACSVPMIRPSSSYALPQPGRRVIMGNTFHDVFDDGCFHVWTGWAPPSISNPPTEASHAPPEPSQASVDPKASTVHKASKEAAEGTEVKSDNGDTEAQGLVAYGSGDSDSHENSSDDSSGLDEDAPRLTSFF